MREKLANLEGVYFKLEESKEVLNIMLNDYFGTISKPYDENERIRLAWDYKANQALLGLVYESIFNQLETLKTNIYGLYNDLKGVSYEK